MGLIMKSSKPFRFKASRKLAPAQLPDVYRTLRTTFGHQHWWPGETPFEVIVGAILTQNTAWTNVEKAIVQLKKYKALNFEAMYALPIAELARLIKPAGFFNLKALRIRAFLDFLADEYQGSLQRLFKEPVPLLRKKLLGVKGIGPETCDSILLYAGQKPVFVIDAYTKRIFSRHGLQPRYIKRSRHKTLATKEYEAWQALFAAYLPEDSQLFNDYHAQIVRVGKDYCRSKKVLCKSCPLSIYI